MSSAPRLSLMEVVDPVFLLFCRLNRAARLKTANLPLSVVRAQVDRCFLELEDRAVAAGRKDQYASIRTPLKCFIDMMIVHGNLPFSQQWDYYTTKNDCGAPGELPFEELKKIMEDSSPSAAELLIVYHTMLSLGFQGMYFPDRGQELRAIYDELCQRVAIASTPPDELQLLPEEYRRIVHAQDRPVTVRGAVWTLVVSVAALVLFGAAVNMTVYRSYTHQLKTDLEAVRKKLDTLGTPQTLSSAAVVRGNAP